MSTLDQRIAQQLEEAAKRGELQRADGYGAPLPEVEGWLDTPPALRMPFKVLKNAGMAPPEVLMFHERAEIRAKLTAETDPVKIAELQSSLSKLEQTIALRLESLRSHANL
jgi:hypothetical protein